MFETLTNADYANIRAIIANHADDGNECGLEDSEIEAIVRFAADVARDCDWAEGSFDVALHELTAADVVRNMARHYDGGMVALVKDALADALGNVESVLRLLSRILD